MSQKVIDIGISGGNYSNGVVILMIKTSQSCVSLLHVEYTIWLSIHRIYKRYTPKRITIATPHCYIVLWSRTAMCLYHSWNSVSDLKHVPTTGLSCLIGRPVNPLRAKFSRGNINIYLHSMSLFHIDMTHVLKILPQVRPGPTYS